MKLINIHILTILVLFIGIGSSRAQSWHIQDNGLFGMKFGLGAGLLGERILKGKQKDRLRDLITIEKDLNKRRGKLSAIQASAIKLYVDNMRADTKSHIETIIKDLDDLKKTARLRHGIIRYEKEVLTEKQYLEELEGSLGDFALSLTSGGPGYNVNATLKVLIRLTEINIKVNEIFMNVKNSIVINNMNFN